MKDLNQYTTKKDHHRTIEGSDFWKSHIDQQQKTRLSKRAYCREAQLDYNRFQYWFHKLQSKSTVRSSKAVPILLKDDRPSKTHKIVGTLEYGKGKRLLIHDPAVIAQLLLENN